MKEIMLNQYLNVIIWYCDILVKNKRTFPAQWCQICLQWEQIFPVQRWNNGKMNTCRWKNYDFNSNKYVSRKDRNKIKELIILTRRWKISVWIFKSKSKLNKSPCNIDDNQACFWRLQAYLYSLKSTDYETSEQ